MVERDPDFSAYFDSSIGLDDFVCIIWYCLVAKYGFVVFIFINWLVHLS